MKTVSLLPKLSKKWKCLLFSETRSTITHYIQETQLLLTNRATHLQVSQGYQTWYQSIC